MTRRREWYNNYVLETEILKLYKRIFCVLKITDIADPDRIKKSPDGIRVLLAGSFAEGGITVRRVELRHFVERTDPKLGPYSLLTILMETDKGDVESLYDEGYRGESILDKTSDFILNNVGLSGIILRLMITLRDELGK